MFNYNDHEFLDNSGKNIRMSEYSNKVLLIVNTASKCGFTPQYLGLQNLYEKYNGQGFEIIAFPCNQFGNQESGTDAEIQSFCNTYNINFKIASKIEVNGENAHPIYKALRAEAKNSEPISWNFEKFVIDKDGRVSNYPPNATPQDLDKLIDGML